MALLQLGPASAAPPPPPTGLAAVKAEAGLTMNGMRDMITMAREFVQLFKEAEPLLQLIRPPTPSGTDFTSEQVPRAPAPEVAAQRSAAPPPSEVDAAKKEEIEKARAELRELVHKRLTKSQILQLAAALGPFALADKMPQLAQALADHAEAADAFLQVFSEEELKDILCEVLPLVPAKDLPLARTGLLQAVKAIEDDAKQKAAAAEPKKEDKA